MRLPRLLALIRKEFIQIWRDPRSLTITFIMPLVQLFLMGYAATSDALKAASLPGPAWDIVVEPLIPALMALEGAPGVAQVALRGDYLHAISAGAAHTEATLRALLGLLGASATILAAEPMLEDVFLALTRPARPVASS